MKKVLLDYGEWEQYYGNSWIKIEWIENRLPYDRMAVDIERAYLLCCREHNLDPKRTLLEQL